MSAPTITYQTQGLSEDCDQIEAGARRADASINAADLLTKLQAFAAIPAVDLIEAKPTINVRAGSGAYFQISNESGSLFMIETPTSENSPMQKSPEEIVAFLDDNFNPPQIDEAPIVVVRSSKTRTVLNSPWLLLVLLGVWAGVAYTTLRDPGPEGVTPIANPDRIATFAAEMQGRYGSEKSADGDSLYVVEADRFKVFDVTEEGVDPDPIYDVGYEFGQQAGGVVLLLETGAVLGRTDGGDLVFGDETYPRL